MVRMEVNIHPPRRTYKHETGETRNNEKNGLEVCYETIQEAGPGSVFGQGDLVCVGDAIDPVGTSGDGQDTYLRGHGTRVDVEYDGKGRRVREVLRATVCGTVERVNKLVTVRPVGSQYTAEVGDVVVGVVTEISGKRWKVGLKGNPTLVSGGGGGGSEGVLHLSAVNLPGGAQRRRTWEDELNMRNVFRETDVVCSEVQSLHADGTVALHARSAKYGKLTSGTLVCVPSFLVKKQKHNFLTFSFGDEDDERAGKSKKQSGSRVRRRDKGADPNSVRVVLGYNGNIWVCSPWGVPLSKDKRDSDDEDSSSSGSESDEEMAENADKGKRKRPGTENELNAGVLYNISTVSNVVRAIGDLMLPVTEETIGQGVGLARNLKVEPNLICQQDFLEKLVDQEAVRRMAYED
ncbi:exosome complex RNA-binding protein [Chloropicon primus]|uniref:Exosome complex RNA-binding protein n=1 Tax=Chloropicon primus TaxID=1764295 RepID=A0A5B8MVU2_9CHLO|nr:exosome complex RNA-binding protein [Chloropicon primus]UPR02792.1 exosome complex RNA-binding protein [Chloropicon primus]|eukprot:QDZ23580.1 exosome complex RNA-binding protein [Chloropicon primus]